MFKVAIVSSSDVRSSNSDYMNKKYRIRETPTLLTDADSRTDSNLKRLRDLSFYFVDGLYLICDD